MSLGSSERPEIELERACSSDKTQHERAKHCVFFLSVYERTCRGEGGRSRAAQERRCPRTPAPCQAISMETTLDNIQFILTFRAIPTSFKPYQNVTNNRLAWIFASSSDGNVVYLRFDKKTKKSFVLTCPFLTIRD